ncbi:MCE family protein [Nocardia sp. 2]|uniref:MCE family protein n=1 Tax=Nocardia acididurans TaxID=2802282 RepID=A0ABS1MFP8_9NOCA|nr:MlaD family protein [Nocardia acididurans]MBL1079409.1 MCE family protein [Nocardia acididurans]
MKPATVRAVLLRLGLFSAAMIALLLVVISAIVRPVSGETTRYSGVFTDVSGLKTGDDVRMYGVQVGKVTGLELDGSRATVEFTVQRDRPVYTTSTLAIRYQTLTGQRYVDVRQPDGPGERLRPGAVIGADRTVPSFDITQLFNGLQPVLAEFSPGALNQFTESVLAVIEGNGDGIGPALDAFEKLSRYVSDRQAVLTLIVENLQGISNQIGGKSPQLITLLEGLADVFTSFRKELDGLLVFAAAAPSTLGPLNSLLATLGFAEGENPNLEADLRLLFPNPDESLEVLGRLPGLLQSLAGLMPPAAGSTAGLIDMHCSKGQAEVPAPFSVLISGQRISICKS